MRVGGDQQGLFTFGKNRYLEWQIRDQLRIVITQTLNQLCLAKKDYAVFISAITAFGQTDVYALNATHGITLFMNTVLKLEHGLRKTQTGARHKQIIRLTLTAEKKAADKNEE